MSEPTVDPIWEFARRLCAGPGVCAPPERAVKRCMNCGSRFDRRLNRRRNFYSRRCRYAWHDLGKMPQRRLDFGR
jgi:hypothetical protein